jgi:hypothetical protein
MDFARNAAIRSNCASAIFSLEMSKIEIVMRLLSAEARVPLHVLRSGQLSDDDWTKLARRMGEISEGAGYLPQPGLRGWPAVEALTSDSNLAGTLTWLGEYRRACELEQDTIGRRRRVLGGDHPNTLTSASHLANTLARLGEYQQARELRQDAADRRRRMLGDDHPDTLTSSATSPGLARRWPGVPTSDRARCRDDASIERSLRLCPARA